METNIKKKHREKLEKSEKGPEKSEKSPEKSAEKSAAYFFPYNTVLPSNPK